MTDIELMRELKLYKKMYNCLFNGIIDAEKFSSKSEIIKFLKEKQVETERIYIDFDM